MYPRGLLRPLKATELSDGTLRYLLWIAALLSARPTGLLVLYEPEPSLLPDSLASTRTINRQRRGAQATAGCHARAEVIASREEQDDCNSVTLKKILGKHESRFWISWIFPSGAGLRDSYEEKS